MKMSMWMFFERIRCLSNATASIHVGQCTISAIRGYIDGVVQSTEYAYVGKPEQFGLLSQFESVIYSGEDYILVDMPIIWVMNQLMDLLAQAEMVDRRLNAAIQTEAPFQEIADLVSELLQRPVVINDNFFCVLGIAGEMPGNSWRYMKTHIASPPEFLGRFVRESDFSVYMTGKAPVVHATPAYALWNASIRVNCFFNDVAMCRIIISIPTPDIDKGIVQFAEYVGTVIERIPASKAHRFFTENIGNTTSMLKFDCEIDKNDEVFLKTKEQFDQCPFRLCRLSMKEPINDRTIYYWLCSQLEALIVESYCFPYQDDIIMIVPATTAVERRISSAIPTLLDHTGFFCTVSNQYEQVESIRECYQQTCGLEKFARPRYQHVYYYEDSALERLVEEIVRQKDWTAWISGSITTLEEYDNAHKTDFLDTLYCLVKYQFVFSHVASALHIHRNSLQYRVSKIEALTGINLSNADQRFFLSLSCRLHKANPKFNSR